jgi:hypothetical protein
LFLGEDEEIRWWPKKNLIWLIWPGITAELLRIQEFVRNFWNPNLAKRADTPTRIPQCDVTLRQGMKQNSAGILRNSDRNRITSFLPEVGLGPE